MASFAAPACIAIDTTAAASKARNNHPGAVEPRIIREWPLVLPVGGPDAALYHELDVARALHGAGKDLWALWEVAMCGEPLVVLGRTPALCSAAVLAIVGMVHPLPYIGDYRPYMCMQDPDYEMFLRAKPPPKGALIGVTNTHMAANLRWPLQLNVGMVKKSASSPNTEQNTQNSRNAQTSTAASAAMASPSSGCVEFKPSRHSQLSKSKKVLKLVSSSDPVVGATRALRAYFAESVTAVFLRAFDRYLIPVRPGRPNHVPFGRPYQLLDFNPFAFPTDADLAMGDVLSLFKKTVSTNRKQAAKELYQRFIGGPVFKAWFAKAHEKALRDCAARHRKEMMAFTVAMLHAVFLGLPNVESEWRSLSRGPSAKLADFEEFEDASASGRSVTLEEPSPPPSQSASPENQLVLRIQFEHEQARASDDAELLEHLEVLLQEAQACSPGGGPFISSSMSVTPNERTPTSMD